MRPWILSLVLITACAGAPEAFAPEVDASTADRTVLNRLDKLERLTERLRAELLKANETIADLESQVQIHDGNFQVYDDAILDFDARLKVQGGNLELHDSALLSLESDIRVLGGDLKFQGSSLLDLGSQVTVLGGNLQLMDSAVLKLQDSSVSVNGRLARVEAYTTALAGPDVAEPGQTQDGLFLVDDETGVRSPRVEGAGLALLQRLRKRPDLLSGEWDALIDQHLSIAIDNPIFQPPPGVQQNVLGRLADEVDRIGSVTWADRDPGDLMRVTNLGHFIDDWQGETAFVRSSLDQLDGEVKELADILKNEYGKRISTLETTTAALDAALDKLEGRTDFLDGQVVYLDTKLKEVKELADILKADYGIRVAALEKAATTTATDIADLRKKDDFLNGQTVYLETKLKEVKDLADILQADYGVRLDDVDGALALLQDDVDDLWVEVLDLSGATCAASDLAVALYLADDASAASAYESIGGQICGTAGPL